MKRPLVWITSLFILGILFGAGAKLQFFWLYLWAVVLFLCSWFLLKKDRAFCILLFLLCFSLGALFLINSRTLAQKHLLKINPPQDSLVFAEGIVQSDPRVKFNKVSFLLKIEKIRIDGRWHKAEAKILAELSDRRAIFYGDRLILEGRLHRPFYFRFSKGSNFNYRNYLRNKGIYLILRAGKKGLIKKTGTRRGNPLFFYVYKIRHRLKRMVEENLSTLSASCLNALLLGSREELPGKIREMLVNTGTVHIIAISGLHLGIMGFITIIFLKVLHLPKRPRFIATILILWVYCILTGSNLPAVRAAIMATILLVGLILKRQADIYNCLSLAALFILFINPNQLFELSFQLSFLSILSLVWLAPKINALFSPRFIKTRRARLFFKVFSSSLGAWLGLFPLIFYYFRIISPIAVLGNMIIVPYMAVVIACGIAFILAGLIFPALQVAFAPATELSILLLLKFIALLEAVPFGHFRLA